MTLSNIVFVLQPLEQVCFLVLNSRLLKFSLVSGTVFLMLYSGKCIYQTNGLLWDFNLQTRIYQNVPGLLLSEILDHTLTCNPEPELGSTKCPLSVNSTYLLSLRELEKNNLVFKTIDLEEQGLGRTPNNHRGTLVDLQLQKLQFVKKRASQ